MSIWFIVARNDAGDREIGILHRGEYIFHGGKKRLRRTLLPPAFASLRFDLHRGHDDNANATRKYVLGQTTPALPAA
jgi:hypothetical protein